jgi:hypothetical protein
MVNRMSGDPSEQLRERHDASDFGTFSAGSRCTKMQSKIIQRSE